MEAAELQIHFLVFVPRGNASLDIQLLPPTEAAVLSGLKGQNYVLNTRQMQTVVRNAAQSWRDSPRQPHTHQALAWADGGTGRFCGELSQFPETEGDRKLLAEILQHAQDVRTLAGRTAGEIESVRGTGHQTHREA